MFDGSQCLNSIMGIAKEATYYTYTCNSRHMGILHEYSAMTPRNESAIDRLFMICSRILQCLPYTVGGRPKLHQSISTALDTTDEPTQPTTFPLT